METHFDSLPKELLGVISSHLPYEDILNLCQIVKISLKEILTLSQLITSYDLKYTLETAPRIPFDCIHTNIIVVNENILIEINSPEDFKRLRVLEMLHTANFILPYNKYESVTEFEKYLNAFFDSLFNRRCNYLLKDLTFRLLYSSSFNRQLGIVMYKGIINLVNCNKFVGFDKDNDAKFDEIDFLVNIIRDKMNVYKRKEHLMYALHTDDYPVIFESEEVNKYFDQNIVPLVYSLSEARSHNKYIEDVFGYMEELGDNIEVQEEAEVYKNIKKEDDYLIVCVNYLSLENYTRKIGKRMESLLDSLPGIYVDRSMNISRIFDREKCIDFKRLSRDPKVGGVVKKWLNDLSLEIVEVYKHDPKLKYNLNIDQWNEYLLSENEGINYNLNGNFTDSLFDNEDQLSEENVEDMYPIDKKNNTLWVEKRMRVTFNEIVYLHDPPEDDIEYMYSVIFDTFKDDEDSTDEDSTDEDTYSL